MKANVSIAPSLFSKNNPINIQTCINNAEGVVAEYLAHSEFIRVKHEEGSKNSSRESTQEGALKSAETVTNVLVSEPEPDVVYFGEHLGEAVRTFKSFFKKK